MKKIATVFQKKWSLAIFSMLLILAISCKDDDVAPVLVSPTDLVATAIVSTNQINLSWSDNSTDETGFRIMRKIGTDVYNLLVTTESDVVDYSNISFVENSTNFYKVAAFNSDGNSTYSNETIVAVDIDGNVYNTVTIGDQVWMKENLRVTKYSNGEPIINITDPTEWAALTTGAWSYYTNDPQFNDPYGKMYNGYTITDSRKICPNGWHVPSDAEWTALVSFLGDIAGGALKEAGTAHWVTPNTAATNTSGFTALPGGYRSAIGTFPFVGVENLGSLGLWWSSSGYDINNLWIRTMGFNFNGVGAQDGNIKAGLSCRCIMD